MRAVICAAPELRPVTIRRALTPLAPSIDVLFSRSYDVVERWARDQDIEIIRIPRERMLAPHSLWVQAQQLADEVDVLILVGEPEDQSTRLLGEAMRLRHKPIVYRPVPRQLPLFPGFGGPAA